MASQTLPFGLWPTDDHHRLLSLRQLLFQTANFIAKEVFEGGRTRAKRRIGRVVETTIIEHQHDVSDELRQVDVFLSFNSLFHTLQIHWLLNYFVIIRNFTWINRFQERPGIFVLLFKRQKIHRLLTII